MSFLKHLHPGWKISLQDKTQVNAAILDAIDQELKVAESDMIASKFDLSLESATGQWLDEYGDVFGVVRQDNETDTAYRARIIQYILLDRGTIPAIKKAILAFLGDPNTYVNIYEPFNNIFFLNKSKLNSKDCLLGEYYTNAVIDIFFSNNFPVAVIDIVKKFKPAGVSVFLTRQPKAYNPAATPFKVKQGTDPVAEAMKMQANRDSTYLSIGESAIIGYKRIHKIMLARPLKDTENVNNPPYPVVMYGNKPFVLVPRDNAVAEGAKWLYINVAVEDTDFLNQSYSKTGVYFNLVPKVSKKDTLLPSEVTSAGAVLITETKDLQGRKLGLKMDEQFMIEFTV